MFDQLISLLVLGDIQPSFFKRNALRNAEALLRPALALEARKLRLSLEEVVECGVHMDQGLLQALRVDLLEPWTFLLKLGYLSRQIVAGKVDLRSGVCHLLGLQRKVVEKACCSDVLG